VVLARLGGTGTSNQESQIQDMRTDPGKVVPLDAAGRLRSLSGVQMEPMGGPGAG